MKDLIVKEVTMNKEKIKAVSKDGKIYVGIKNIGKNLGMTENQINGQRQKIQKDLTLKRGCVSFHAGVFEKNNSTLGIELNYLPLWLAKINPIHFSDELKEVLLYYQLWAKDILSDAFFGKREKEIPLLPENKDWALKRIHDRADQAKILEEHKMCIIEKLEKIYEEIAGVANLKKNTVGSKFFNFKEKGYDASKEKLPSLELEKNNDGSIEIKVK